MGWKLTSTMCSLESSVDGESSWTMLNPMKRNAELPTGVRTTCSLCWNMIGPWETLGHTKVVCSLGAIGCLVFVLLKLIWVLAAAHGITSLANHVPPSAAMQQVSFWELCLDSVKTCLAKKSGNKNVGIFGRRLIQPAPCDLCTRRRATLGLCDVHR